MSKSLNLSYTKRLKFSIHKSDGETFRGIGILDAAKAAAEGRVSVAAVKLYDFLENKMAKIVGDYFKLDEPLYPDFIHLVCRYPLDVKEDDGEGNLILRKLLLKYLFVPVFLYNLGYKIPLVVDQQFMTIK